MEYCKYCGVALVYIQYDNKQYWLHRPGNTTLKETVYAYCEMTKATPRDDVPDAEIVVLKDLPVGDFRDRYLGKNSTCARTAVIKLTVDSYGTETHLLQTIAKIEVDLALRGYNTTISDIHTF